MTIEQLLTDLKMKGSLEALSSLKEIQDRDQFTTALLRAELKEKERQQLLVKFEGRFATVRNVLDELCRQQDLYWTIDMGRLVVGQKKWIERTVRQPPRIRKKDSKE